MPPPRNNKRYNRGNSVAAKYPKNERIRAREVRVVGPSGQQYGVKKTEEAVKLAKDAGFDLVLVAQKANPPVARILDFGKFLYEQSKKQKDNKTTSSKIKEVKFRLRIEQHDYDTKLRHAEEFLGKGNKVKMTLTMRGREMQHKDIGFETMNRAINDMQHIASADSDPRIAGNRISAMLSPLPVNKRKFKFTTPPEETDEEDVEDENLVEEEEK
ncbi:MAG: translation initiation factor IF-3 [Opitutales bacterium]|nr:translation initiation factor IF-3 [Opitutales bacterium]